MNFFPGMDISRDLPREQKLKIKEIWRISQFRHLENTSRRRDKNSNKLKTQWKLVVCFAFKFYCIFDWCSFLSRVARVQTTLPSIKNPQRGFCDLPLIIFYVFTNNFTYIKMTKNSVARIFPTSSPGSSRFPIWRRQARRPWHTAEIRWLICPRRVEIYSKWRPR